jgi:DNA-binding MarR family transcriptional regulator
MSECLCLCNAIQNAASLLDRQLNAALNGLDISHCQASVLVELVPQSATVSHLSKALCCSCGNISQLVDALESKQLVERVQSEHDRRRAEVKLTAKGRKLGEQARDALSTRASDCCKRRVRTLRLARARSGFLPRSRGKKNLPSCYLVT